MRNQLLRNAIVASPLFVFIIWFTFARPVENLLLVPAGVGVACIAMLALHRIVPRGPKD